MRKTDKIHGDLNPTGLLAFGLAIGVLACLLAGNALADDSLDPAAAQFKKSCGTCHTVDPKAPARQGPNLHGVIGRPAGTLKGFKYSAAFLKANAGKPWTPERIDQWITDPQQMAPGTIMLYHQSDADKRQLIIKFLEANG
jgi:cytochrome c